MKRAAIIFAFLFAAPVFAAPGGQIDTVQIGRYVCELPGDATGPAGRHVPEQDFSIINASSYQVGTARGIYLLTGDRMVMTSGPRRGQQFHRVSASFLRLIGPDGKDSDLRCIRRTRNNS